MNGLVLYKSRYGATRQYADWLGTDLKLPVIDPERMDDSLLAACDFLLIGASVYNGELLIKDWLDKNQHRLGNKKLFLFIVCAPTPDAGKHHQIILDNIPRSIWIAADIVFLPGRWILRDLSLVDSRTLEEKARIENDPAKKDALSQDKDAVKKEHIAALLTTIRSFAVRTD
jgi:menaquinone-dependent protoporphyrinogen IX oxidase